MNHRVSNTDHPARIPYYDIYLVGVGGQGVLTIGDLIADVAQRQGVPVSFYPTKGMAQRGGFVKAQIRVGRQRVGPSIAERSADLVIAMEVSEALKAVRFIKPGKDFVLFGHIWPPTDVMLGKAPYPSLDQVLEQVRKAGGKVHYLAPESLPLYKGTSAPANIYVLGAALGNSGLGGVLSPSEMARVVQTRWADGAERNVFAFRAGLEANVKGS